MSTAYLCSMKPIILIDNGHGVDCKGKCSPDALAGKLDSPYYFREYKWCREVAQMCCDVLQAQGFSAWLLVPEETDIPLATRVQRVNDFCKKYGNNNVLLISVHNNAAGSGKNWMSARGWSIWTTKGITEADKLAESIYNVAKQEFRYPQTVRTYSNQTYGKDYEEDFYILKRSYCPAVLIEHFFQDNKEDVAYLKTKQCKGSCVEVIVKGIENYLQSK